MFLVVMTLDDDDDRNWRRQHVHLVSAIIPTRMIISKSRGEIQVDDLCNKIQNDQSLTEVKSELIEMILNFQCRERTSANRSEMHCRDRMRVRLSEDR